MTLSVTPVTGAELAAVIPALARLRIAVFRDFPYLYDGDLAYEADYLADFARAGDAVIVVARDGEEIVGAATAAPLETQDTAWQEPLAAAGFDIARTFYFGEIGAARKPSRPRHRSCASSTIARRRRARSARRTPPFAA